MQERIAQLLKLMEDESKRINYTPNEIIALEDNIRTYFKMNKNSTIDNMLSYFSNPTKFDQKKPPLEIKELARELERMRQVELISLDGNKITVIGEI